MSWGPQEVVAFVEEDMRDLAQRFGTSLAFAGTPYVEDGNLVVEGITTEGSLIRSKFSIMHEYAVTNWA